MLFNTRCSLPVETTVQLLAYFLQAFKAWHFFHGFPKYFPADVLWKLFFPFPLQWWEPLLLTVSSSWAMVHSKKPPTYRHWPHITGGYREESWRHGIILEGNKAGKQFFASSLGKMQTSLNCRVWETASFKSSKKFMLIYPPFTVAEHEPSVLARTISSLLTILNKKERWIKGGSAWTTSSGLGRLTASVSRTVFRISQGWKEKDEGLALLQLKKISP